MGDREQLRDALDLVDDHGLPFGRAGQQVPQPLGARAQAAVKGRVEQVQVQRSGQAVAQPRALACAARAEPEATLLGDSEKTTD